MHSIPSISCTALWVVCLALLIAAEEFTDRKVTGLAEGAGRNGVYFQYPRPFSSLFPNLVLSIHLVAKSSTFVLSFVLISYWAGIEVTSSPDISYSFISTVALNMAPIAITTSRYPGENLQVLKFLRQT